MKKLLYTCIIGLAFALPIWANDATYTAYKIKAQFIGGYLYPHDKSIIEPLTKGPMLGGEVAFEWASDGSKDWHKAFNNPDVGLALQVIDLGNPKVAGQIIGLYPYVNLPLYKNNMVSFNTKIGGGLGFATKPCDVAGAIADPRSIKNKAGDFNFAIGGPVNFAISAGINLEVKVHPNVALTADVMYNHYSSASLFQPNGGLNMFNGYIGLKYLINKEITPNSSLLTPNSDNPSTGSGTDSTALPIKRWGGEIILSGSAKKLYYQDDLYFGCASLNIEGYYRTCKQHRIGLGFDLFFDDAYQQTVALNSNGKYEWTNEYTKFKRTCTPDNKFSNKLRLGINIANELTIGKVGIFAHVGIYLYDPIKNMEPADKCLKALNGQGDPIKKGLFYTYDINDEDGWNYFRVGVKYHITPHFLVNVSFKTHLQKVEFAEFGIGYAF